MACAQRFQLAGSGGLGAKEQDQQVRNANTTVPGPCVGGISGKLHVLSRNAQVGKERSTWETVMGHAKATAGMSYDEGRPIRDHQTVACNTRAIERGLHTVPARCGKVNPDKDTSLIQGRICASHSAFKLPVFGPDSGRFPRISPKLPRGAFAAMEPSGLAAGIHNENHEAVMHRLQEGQSAGSTDCIVRGLAPRIWDVVYSLPIRFTPTPTRARMGANRI